MMTVHTHMCMINYHASRPELSVFKVFSWPPMLLSQLLMGVHPVAETGSRLCTSFPRAAHRGYRRNHLGRPWVLIPSQAVPDARLSGGEGRWCGGWGGGRGRCCVFRESKSVSKQLASMQQDICIYMYIYIYIYIDRCREKICLLGQSLREALLYSWARIGMQTPFIF